MGILKKLNEVKLHGTCQMCTQTSYTYWFEITWSSGYKSVACSNCAKRERKKEWERIMIDGKS